MQNGPDHVGWSLQLVLSVFSTPVGLYQLAFFECNGAHFWVRDFFIECSFPAYCVANSFAVVLCRRGVCQHLRVSKPRHLLLKGYCYDSSTYFLICFLLFNYVPFICFSISFSSCTVCLLMHSPAKFCTVLHSLAQSCTVCLLMCSLLRRSLVTQYIRTVWTVVFC